MFYEEITAIENTQKAKDALRCLSYGVYVVSARRGDAINALTMRMVSQVSTQPPCIALSMRRRCYTYQFIVESEAFAVSVLARGQELLAGHFSLRSGRTIDKFAGVNYESGITNAPILQDCCAFMECRLLTSHEMGNSSLLIGEIINADVRGGPPLIYRREDYYG